VAGRGLGGAPSFLKTWRPSFKIRQWPEVLAAPPCPEDPAAGTQVPKIRRPTLLPQDLVTDAQGNLSLFIPWVWNNYSIPEPIRRPSAPGHVPAGACYSVFSRASPIRFFPSMSPTFSYLRPTVRFLIFFHRTSVWFLFFFALHGLHSTLLCQGEHFFLIKHFIKIVSNLDMLFIQELIHLSHDHIGTLEFEYSKIARSSWPWYWKQELHNLNTTILRHTSISIMVLNNPI
jgi:hypothetical protein